MGNILFNFKSEKKQIQDQMKRPFIKVVPNKLNSQNQINSNHKANNIFKVNNPQLNHKKGGNQRPHTGAIQAQKKTLSNQEITNKIKQLIVQQLQFDLSWNKFLQITSNVFKFNLLFPLPLNSQGQNLLKNGSFIYYWLTLISKNSFINMPMIYKNARENYLPKIQTEKHILQSFLKQMQERQQKKTPLKYEKNQELLKRSILKNSDKKVKFGLNQIIYPQLEQYRILPIQKQTKQQRKQQIRKQNSFLLDYFQVNDIFLLDEIQIVGVIKQFNSTYAIIQVKQNSNLRQKTCIGKISKDSTRASQIKILQMIEKQFQNLCYLQLEGKDPSAIWVDCIPNDSLK